MANTELYIYTRYRMSQHRYQSLHLKVLCQKYQYNNNQYCCHSSTCHTRTLSHLGIIFCKGCLASLSSTVVIFCPSVPIVFKNFLNPLVDPISLSMGHTNPLKRSVPLQHIEAVCWKHYSDFSS